MNEKRFSIRLFTIDLNNMSEQEVKEFEENIVKGANIAFQKLVNEKKKENGELVFSRNGKVFRVKAVELESFVC
ncbi:hypothetical protein M2137_001373 [Parabacteroides sp. PFB2-10]|nr:hypothetical protein [Parabacteroides sp. PFB2-10]